MACKSCAVTSLIKILQRLLIAKEKVSLTWFTRPLTMELRLRFLAVFMLPAPTLASFPIVPSPLDPLHGALVHAVSPDASSTFCRLPSLPASPDTSGLNLESFQSSRGFS